MQTANARTSTPIAVSTAPATARDLPVTITGTGSFVADEESQVAAQTAGAVVATPVDLGARVRRGQVIVHLDPRDAQLRLDQARASRQQAEAAHAQARERHALAQANAVRYEALVRTGDVSKSLQEQASAEAETTRQGVATAEAAIADARARVAIVEKVLADATITAPFDGFVTDRAVAVGEYVTPGTRVATVMKLDPIRLRLQVPERQSARIAVGQPVLARVEALGSLRIDGRITAISAALDPSTRSVLIEAQVPNPNGRIRAAMFATTEMALPETKQAVFVPREAIASDTNTNSSRVFVIEGDVARLRVVQPGPVGEDGVRIVSGVSPGDRVATSRLSELFDGAKVTTVQRATRN
ncbi:MAG: efflux RND transporter periplasmic adaptor subunit [Vicinamibacterales bacterium]